jgi:hypothetical protein
LIPLLKPSARLLESTVSHNTFASLLRMHFHRDGPIFIRCSDPRIDIGTMGLKSLKTNPRGFWKIRLNDLPAFQHSSTSRWCSISVKSRFPDDPTFLNFLPTCHFNGMNVYSL